MHCLKCGLRITHSAHYGLHLKCFCKWFDTRGPAEFISLQRRSSDSHQKSTPNSQNTSFFHGKFKKYSAHLDGHSYILKMRQDEAPELPEVEYLCNQIAESLGIPVAEFYYIDFNDDRTFVTKNFIKPSILNDLQHLYHFRSDDHHSCEGIINAIIKKTKLPHDINIFINTVLFDSLIGNHDRHGRNLAFIVTAKNSCLSPIYDNVSYLSLESGKMLKADFNPTGKIGTKETLEPNMSDYVKEFKRLLYLDEVKKFYRRIDLSRLNQLIENSFCSTLMKQAMKTLITKRYEELKYELLN